MVVMITYHGYNNLIYNVHKNMSVHYTQQNTLHHRKGQLETLLINDCQPNLLCMREQLSRKYPIWS